MTSTKISYPPLNSMMSHEYAALDLETRTDFETIRLTGVKYAGVETDMKCVVYAMRSIFETVDLLADLKGKTVLTWNGARFDLPLLRHKGFTSLDFRHTDVMQLFKIVFHDEKKFSLEYWGNKVFKKGKVEGIDYDNSDLSDLMVYLDRDLDLTLSLFNWIIKQPRFKAMKIENIERALKMEERVAQLVSEQVRKRVLVDKLLGYRTLHSICEEMKEIEEDLAKELPVVNIPPNKLDHPPKIQFKKDGEPSAVLLKYLDRHGFGASYNSSVKQWRAVSRTSRFNITLPLTAPLTTQMKLEPKHQAQIKEYLLDRLGWFPTEYNVRKQSDGTYKETSPRLTLKESGEPCPNLDKIKVTWVADLALWLKLRNRKNVLQSDNGTGWLPLASDYNRVYSEYSIPSDADTLGANTARWTHKVIANVPRPKSFMGTEMRSMLCAREDKVWVGWDASALEARVEAHYTHPLDPMYANELVDGDVHQRNLEKLPAVGDRDGAKKFKYAVTYGAKAPKLARTFDWTPFEAETVFNDFWKGNAALRQLRDNLEEHWMRNDKKFIMGLDGRIILTRSKHSLLNALFQSAGAIIMKYAMVVASNKIKSEFSEEEAYGLIRYHDEEVWECNPEHAQRIAEIGVASIVAAGKYLGLRVPLAGEAKIGNNWAEVH